MLSSTLSHILSPSVNTSFSTSVQVIQTANTRSTPSVTPIELKNIKPLPVPPALVEVGVLLVVEVGVEQVEVGVGKWTQSI